MTPVQMYEHVGCSVLGLHRREKFEMDSITQKVLASLSASHVNPFNSFTLTTCHEGKLYTVMSNTDTENSCIN